MKASCSESGLTTAQDEEIRRRWGAMTGALATTGEENAVKQLALNQNSRRNAITEIVGRAQIGAKEFESLKAVAPERRIADVLLTIPRGAERAAAVEDALTPPAEGESVEALQMVAEAVKAKADVEGTTVEAAFALSKVVFEKVQAME